MSRRRHVACVTVRGRCHPPQLWPAMAFHTRQVPSPMANLASELQATVLASASRSRATIEAYTDKSSITRAARHPIMAAVPSSSHAGRRVRPCNEPCLSAACAGAARAASAAAMRSWPPDPPRTEPKASTWLTPRHRPAWPYWPPYPSSSTNFRRNGGPTKTRSAVLHSVK